MVIDSSDHKNVPFPQLKQEQTVCTAKGTRPVLSTVKINKCLSSIISWPVNLKSKSQDRPKPGSWSAACYMDTLEQRKHTSQHALISAGIQRGCNHTGPNVLQKLLSCGSQLTAQRRGQHALRGWFKVIDGCSHVHNWHACWSLNRGRSPS